MSCTMLSRAQARQLVGSSSSAPVQQPTAALARLPARRSQLRRQVVVAAAQPDSDGQQLPSAIQDLQRNAGLMLQRFERYDFLSAGLGALAVTTFCVVRGQDPTTALWITGASTVMALLLNEMLFDDNSC